MSNYFDAIKTDYEHAEITCLILQDKAQKRYFSLLTLIELVPAEQEPSSTIGTADSKYLERLSVTNHYTVYLARMLACPCEVAINTFLAPEKGIFLKQGKELNAKISLFDNVRLEQEPPSDNPLVINASTESTFGKILPKRNTPFRVWAKIDRAKPWLENLDEKTKLKLLEKAGTLTRKHLCFDVGRLPEHMGNLYLFCCNPYLRRFDNSLLDFNKDLLISFRERQGKSIVGKKLVLEDKRAGNLSFSLERTISSRYERIELPHFPNQLHTKLYDSNGFLIEHHTGTWINFSFQMQIQTMQLNLTVKTEKGKKKFSVPKHSSQQPLTVGEYDHSLAYYLKRQQQTRAAEELQKNREFFFFAGASEQEKETARNVIGELLNKAAKRCMMLDPYFGAGDLFYAYVIRSMSVPIQIISSAAFLCKKIGPRNGRQTSQAVRLKKELDKFRKAFPHQSIECRVLLGSNKSPLHDRYIVVDDTVYLLGSSFNEFGGRATTLIKLPVPDIMIKQALEWWTDGKKSVKLTDFVKRPKNKK